MRYLLLLGSNIDKEINLPRARELLGEIHEILDVSGVFESEAVGAAGTPRFYNQALLVESAATAEEMLARHRGIEVQLGRLRSDDPNAPRPIDIDVILGVEERGRVAAAPVPDPDLGRLHHVAIPAAELAGHLRLEDGRSLVQVARALGPLPPGFVRVGPEPIAPPPDVTERMKELRDGQIECLGRYLALLLTANARFNLTAVTDPAEAWRRHLVDSLTLLPPLSYVAATSVIDVGSGGGLPGVPLAIAAPHMQLTLLESTRKKAYFLESVARDLALDNIRVIEGRAEELGRDPGHREQYDAVVARAVGPLNTLIELSAPLAQIGGSIIAIKGEQAEAEIAAARRALHELHTHVVGLEQTPTGTLVLMEKMRRTPRKYPRRPGEPKRTPLQ